jgi:predicted ATP-dependent serine protease
MTPQAKQESMEMATTTMETFPPLDRGIVSKPTTGAVSSDGNSNVVSQAPEQQGLAVTRPVWAVPVGEWRENYERQDRGLAELWGPLLLKGALTLLVGQSSVGKSVLLYRLAEALAIACSAY